MDEYGFNIIIRPEWGAKMSKGYETPAGPLPYVMLFYNTETEKCTTREECSKIMHEIQTFHQKHGLSDIHFNFLIGGDGMVYEGRGWHRTPSKCVRNHEYDDKNYAFAYIGDWHRMPVPDVMKTSFLKLVALGVRRGYITEDYEVTEEKEDGIPLIGGYKRSKQFRRRHRGRDGFGCGLTMLRKYFKHRPESVSKYC